MKKRGLLFIICMLLAVTMRAQTEEVDTMLDFLLYEDESAEVDSLIDRFLWQEEAYGLAQSLGRTYHFVYAFSDLSNRSVAAGRELGSEQRNVSGQLFYFNTKGFNLGLGGVWYSQTDPGYTTTVLSAGYGNAFPGASNLRYMFSYNRFLYHLPEGSPEPSYKNSFSLGLNLRNEWVGVRINGSLLSGEEYGAQASGSLFSRIPIVKFGKSNHIRLEPEIAFYLGSEAVAKTVTGLPPTAEEEWYYENQFGFLNTSLRLPLSISYQGFDLEVGFIYDIPRSLDPAYDLVPVSWFSFSLGYLIQLR